jgi:hypothetical protein
MRLECENRAGNIYIFNLHIFCVAVCETGRYVNDIPICKIGYGLWISNHKYQYN